MYHHLFYSAVISPKVTIKPCCTVPLLLLVVCFHVTFLQFTNIKIIFWKSLHCQLQLGTKKKKTNILPAPHIICSWSTENIRLHFCWGCLKRAFSSTDFLAPACWYIQSHILSGKRCRESSLLFPFHSFNMNLPSLVWSTVWRLQDTAVGEAPMFQRRKKTSKQMSELQAAHCFCASFSFSSFVLFFL